MVVGKFVRILRDLPDEEQIEIGRGKVISIGDNLELYLKDKDSPVTKGRLIIDK